MMDQYIANFPKQIIDAIHIAESFQWQPPKKINTIIITGMGGSGIGGTLVQEYAMQTSSLPIFINKSYHLPAFANAQTLLIASSYSGNTEETLSCFSEAIQKKCPIIAITSGGKLETECKNHQYPVILIPKGYPPRTCLGYSFVQLLNILSRANIIDNAWKDELKSAANLLLQEQEAIKQNAKNIAQQIHKTYPVIYTLDSEALAIRLRQQLNENSKILCSHHVIPEMNHNEILGWKCLNAHHTVISILTDFDLPQNKKRYSFCKDMLYQRNVPVIELKAKGNTKLEQWMYIIHTSDWISYELAILNQVDPVEVNLIEELKHYLSK